MPRRPPPCRRTRTGRSRFRSPGWRRRSADPAARSPAGRSCRRTANAASGCPSTRLTSLRATPRDQKHRQSGTLRDRYARTQRVSLSCVAGADSRAPMIAKPDIRTNCDGLKSHEPSGVKPVEAGHFRFRVGKVAGQRAQIAVRASASRQVRPAPPALSVAGAAEGRAPAGPRRYRRPPPARANRRSRPAYRRAWSIPRHARSDGAERRPAPSTSASRLSQGTSGWRRIVPVEEHGASSSTASNGPPAHSAASATTVSAVEAQACQVLPQAQGGAPSGRRAVTWAPPAAVGRSCRRARRRDRPPPCPQISPSRRAGSAAAASCTHQTPSAKPGSCGTGP